MKWKHRIAWTMVCLAGLVAILVLVGCTSNLPEISQEALLAQEAEGRIKMAVVSKKALIVHSTDGEETQRHQLPGSPEEIQELAHRLEDKGVHVIRPLSPWKIFGFMALAWLVLALHLNRVQHFARSALAGLFYLSLLWWWHSMVPMPAEIEGFFTIGALRHKFFLSGPIPPVILWTFLATVHYLYQVFKFELLPLKSAQNQAPKAPTESPSHSDFVTERLDRLEKRFRRDGDLAAVIALKDDMLENDEERFALAFTTVRWSETALPLLGFLGTVIGIGEAMSGVSTGIGTLFEGQPMEMALDDLNQGFSGMAVAFDTTFLGLGGLIVVGALHMALRKGLADNLAEARTALGKAVELWVGGNGQGEVVAALAAIQQRLLGLELQMDHREKEMRKNDQCATAFRETSRLMVTRVIREDSQFKSIRHVLLRPVVEFQKTSEDLSNRTRDLLQRELGGEYKLMTLGPSMASDRGGILVAEDSKGTPWLLPISVHGPQRESLRSMEGRLQSLIALDEKRLLALALDRAGADESAPVGRLLALGLEGGEVEVTPVGKNLSLGDEIHPVLLDGEGAVLWLHHHGGVGQAVEARLWPEEGQRPLDSLPMDYRWEKFSVHTPSATLFALGAPAEGGPSRLLIARLEKRVEPAEEGAKSAPKATVSLVGGDRFVDLPPDLAPQKVIALSSEVVLLLDADGVLHYWDISRSRPQRLSHPEWGKPADTTLRAGRDGWLAVAKNDRLSMWQVHRGGWLERYEGDGFDISALQEDSLCPSLDGSLLYGLSDDGVGVFAWEFPKLAIDDF